MRLVQTLAAGIEGANFGTVELYKHLTASRATWFRDFEGASQQLGDVSLDAYGRALVYVNEVVRLVVKDQTGAVVMTVDDGHVSPAVEVMSRSFTGNDYQTGNAGVNFPAALQTVLDRWIDSAGAPDWRILVGNATLDIRTLGYLAEVFFVVTDPRYGAVGDGVVDDTAAISAAIIAAAVRGGGIVFFPAGTYRTTARLTVGNNIQFMGVGAVSSIIRLDHPTAAAFGFNFGLNVNRPQWMWGLTVDHAQNNTGNLIECAGQSWLTIRECLLGHNTRTNGTVVAHVGVSGHRTVLQDTTVRLGTGVGVNSKWINGFAGAGNSSVEAYGCTFIAPAAAWTPSDGILMAQRQRYIGCRFDLSALAVGAIVLTILAAPDGETILIGNTFTDDGGGTAGAVTGIAITDDGHFVEDDNIILCTVGTRPTRHADGAAARIYCGSRHGRTAVMTVTGGAVVGTEADARDFDTLVFNVTDAGNFTPSLSTPPFGGEDLTIVFRNASAGASGTLAVPSGRCKGTLVAGVTIAAGEVVAARFRGVSAVTDTTLAHYIQLGEESIG